MKPKFNIDDRVLKIEGSECRRGVVKKVIPDLPVMVVEFEDGETEKVAIDDVILAPKIEEKPETQEEQKREEKAISITPSEFTKVAVSVAISASEGDLNIASMFGYFASEIHKALFMTEANND